MVLLRRLRVYVLLGLLLDQLSSFDLLGRRPIGCSKAVGVQESLEPVVSLPERYVPEAEALERAEPVVRPWMVPLAASCESTYSRQSSGFLSPGGRYYLLREFGDLLRN